MGPSHVLGGTLAALPESLAFASLLGLRSAGIVDLRHGQVTAEEWHGQGEQLVAWINRSLQALPAAAATTSRGRS